MIRIAGIGGLALALLVVMDQGVRANPLKSLYTTIDLHDCSQEKVHPDGNAWTCPGLDGYPVYIAEGDLRTFVSVGPDAPKRRAAKQTLRPFNSLFKPNSQRATLEWRFVKRDGRVIPYATIQRIYTRLDGRSGEVLVVTRVTDREDCHVAYIDALANDDAIALARHIADTESRKFRCNQEPQLHGKTGRSPM